MDFSLGSAETDWRDRVRGFIDEHVRPRTIDYDAQQREGERWKVLPVIEELKEKARAEGLWNLFMPPSHGATPVDESVAFEGPALSNLQYAVCAEEIGRIMWSSEVFNCSAPDTGNMEVLNRYGTREQKDEWLRPLMHGEIRSAFLMTEPGVASSDATNIECRIETSGNEYVINGRKWWSSGAGDPRCRIAILMGKTDPSAELHKQQSMVLVPLDAPGIIIKRHLPVFGYDDAPHGHMEIELNDVHVPRSNMLLGEGRGFEIAQGRLGPRAFLRRNSHSSARRRPGRGAPPGDCPPRVQEAQVSVEAMDGEALGRWLEAYVEGFSGPFELRKFPSGQSNPTYRITAASG